MEKDSPNIPVLPESGEGEYFHDEVDLQILRLSKHINPKSLDVDELYIH